MIFRAGADGRYRELVAGHLDLEAFFNDRDPTGEAIAESLPPVIAARKLYHLRAALRTGHLQVYEQQLQIGDRLLHEEIRIAKQSDDEVLVMVRDISARRQAEANLTKRDRVLIALIDVQRLRLAGSLRLATYQRILALLGAIACSLPAAIAAAAQRQARACGRAADLHLELAEAEACIDLVHVEKLVGELVDNACKFSPAGCPIAVSSGTEDETAWIAVTDAGRGLTPEQIARVGAYQLLDAVASTVRAIPPRGDKRSLLADSCRLGKRSNYRPQLRRDRADKTSPSCSSNGQRVRRSARFQKTSASSKLGSHLLKVVEAVI